MRKSCLQSNNLYVISLSNHKVIKVLEKQ